MSLFCLGDFVLRSGQRSAWKIECDALTPGDWAALARMAADVLPPFGAVLGVPRGGAPFAAALAAHAAPTGSPGDTTLLVAEDVVTTGGVMQRFVDESAVAKSWDVILGVCVFARGPNCPSWVTPLFQMPLREGKHR